MSSSNDNKTITSNMDCETIRQRLLTHGYDIDYVYPQGVRGCTYRMRDENNRFYVKKILNQEDWEKFNNVRRDFDEKEVDFFDFHPQIILYGTFDDNVYFIDMEMGEAVLNDSNGEVMAKLHQLHQHGLYHGDLLRSGGHGHGAPVLNVHNVVRLATNELRFIDFGNQYGHNDPLSYEISQRQLSTTDVREKRQRKIREQRRKNAEARRSEAKNVGIRLDFGDSPKKRKRALLQGGNGLCWRKEDLEACVHTCQLDNTGITRWLQESAMRMRHKEDINKLNDGDSKETYMMIRRVAERANQVARRLDSSIDDFSLPPGWDPSNLTDDWEMVFKVLKKDVMEGHIGYYENDSYETLDAKYPTALAPGFQLRQREHNGGKFCIIYLRQHLVLAEKTESSIVILNSAETMGEWYSATWCDLAKRFFQAPNATCRVEHLDVQKYNDCSVWVQLLMARQYQPGKDDPEIVFKAFVEKF
jgi:hypothetical protein